MSEPTPLLPPADLGRFFIVNDDGYPELRYCVEGDDEGEFVCFAEAGTPLDELVKAANDFAASAGR